IMSSFNIANSVAHNQNLSSFNTFALSSFAEQYFDLKTKDQLQALAVFLGQSSLLEQVFILGGGSNVVLPQQLSRFVIHNQIKGIDLLADEDDFFLVKAAGGEVWHDFVQHCLKQGWHGLENLALIPGTVGAAPVQNIGAYGVEVERFVVWVEVLDWRTGEVLRMSSQGCAFAYRDSVFKQERGRWLILKVHFAFPKQWQAVLDYPDLQHAPELQEVPTP